MDETKLLRAAAYVRVSTTMDTQDGSYEAQKEYYEHLITSDPTLKFAGIYGDHKSGRDMKKRPELQRLLKDCKAGLVDVIFCKSISRFSRNMRECIDTVRKLRKQGVSVRFERDGVDTGTMQGEFIFSIMAAIAAEESNSISQNLKGARNKALQRGEIWSTPRYGYKKGENHSWVVCEQEADHVRRIFSLAAQGTPYVDILHTLNTLEEQEGTGRKWSHAMLKGVLRSEAYIGDYESGKHVRIIDKDGKTHVVKNDGVEEQIYIEDHHPAIISRELFHAVEEIVERGLLKSQRFSISDCDQELINYATRVSKGLLDKKKRSVKA